MQVGPESAGARPGAALLRPRWRRPASCGLTDVNLALGCASPRIRFPFALDRARVDRSARRCARRPARFAATSARRGDRRGLPRDREREHGRGDPPGLGRAGLRRARRTRSWSSAARAASTRARSPGASACEHVLFHPLAGVLSAYGMGTGRRVQLGRRGKTSAGASPATCDSARGAVESSLRAIASWRRAGSTARCRTRGFATPTSGSRDDPTCSTCAIAGTETALTLARSPGSDCGPLGKPPPLEDWLEVVSTQRFGYARRSTRSRSPPPRVARVTR